MTRTINFNTFQKDSHTPGHTPLKMDKYSTGNLKYVHDIL